MNIPGVGILSMTEDRGRPAGRIFPGGATRTTPLDAYGRPTAITANDPGGNPLLALPFTFDKNDNVTAKGTAAYSYDNTDQLTGVQDPAKPTEAFGYDFVGNRKTHAQGINVTTAAFNENNELESVGGVSYTYDQDGNLSTKTENGVTTVYTWDVDNRLIQVTNTNGLNAQYSYDVFGKRLGKTVNGATTFFEYADEGLIAEMTSDGTITKTYGWKIKGKWGTDPLWMHVVNSTTEPMGYFWYQNDHLGTPQKLTNPSGAVVWSATADAFGNATVDPASTIVNNLRFSGQYYDEETGLHSNWWRYYDPLSGRYISEDPIGTLLRLGFADAMNGQEYSHLAPNESPVFNRMQSNSYGYVMNNPTGLVDRFGLYWENVHYDMTRDVAERVGFSKLAADIIATADQMVDVDPRTEPFFSDNGRELYHFATPDQLQKLRDKAFCSGNPVEFGEYLHALQDSYSHHGYGPRFGHLFAGTKPDNPLLRPELYRQMRTKTREELSAFKNVMR
jgi:RHS repeat-associated protein